MHEVFQTKYGTSGSNSPPYPSTGSNSPPPGRPRASNFLLSGHGKKSIVQGYAWVGGGGGAGDVEVQIEIISPPAQRHNSVSVH